MNHTADWEGMVKKYKGFCLTFGQKEFLSQPAKDLSRKQFGKVVKAIELSFCAPKGVSPKETISQGNR